MLIEKSPQPALQQNKKTVSIWFRILANLTFWVLIAIIAGVVLGSYAPATAVKMEIIGKTFIDIIKLFIAPIIFLNDRFGDQWYGRPEKGG
jgi:aerobic C4-dicarboxylate transport protein